MFCCSRANVQPDDVQENGKEGIVQIVLQVSLDPAAVGSAVKQGRTLRLPKKTEHLFSNKIPTDPTQKVGSSPLKICIAAATKPACRHCPAS